MVSGLHHIGIVVPTEQQAQELMAMFGWEYVREQYVANYQARCIFVSAADKISSVELIIPTGGRLSAFNKGAGGIHHMALRVADLGAAQYQLAARGIDLLEKQPVDAGPILINFIPPAFTRGIITELVQDK